MRLKPRRQTILAANREDMESSGLEDAMRDRLLLTPERIKEMAQGVRDVAALAIRLAKLWRSGRGRMACASARCACRWAWWESSTNRGRTLRSIRPCLR